MSYEIVKNIRVVPNPENKSEFLMVCKSASNNVHPHYYEEWTYGKGKGMSKEEVEKEILKSFFNGSMQGGQSSYRKFIRQFGSWCDRTDNEYLARYYRLGKTIDKVSTRMWKLKNEYYAIHKTYDGCKESNKRIVQLSDLYNRLYDMQDSELKNTLYSHYLQARKEKKIVSKVAPFVIIDKISGEYVCRVTPRRYYTSRRRHLHTSGNLYNRVHNSDWWNKYFIIEQVSQALA